MRILNFTVGEANERGVALEEAVQRLADLLTPGTTLVAHNIQFDLEQCLARTVSRMGSAALRNCSRRYKRCWPRPGSALCDASIQE